MRRFVLACFVLTLSCSSERERDVPIAAPAPVVRTPARTVSALGRFARALERAKPVVREGDRLVVQVGADPHRRLLGTELPARADRPMRVWDANDRDGFWLEVRALDAKPVTASVHEGHGVILEDVAAETDVVHFATDTLAEELRVLRGPAASPRARYELAVGPSVASVRLREGRIELVDASGFVRVTSAPMFAVDAKGKERAVAVSLAPSGGRTWTLQTSLDVEGLAYPIVVDPAWSSTALMNRNRTRHVSFTLNDGRAVAASSTGGDPSTSAEAYNPATNTWSNIASMPQPHDAGAAGVVFTAGTRSGWALVAGEGYSDETGSFYNPSTNSWVKTPALATAANDVSLILLSDGHRALLVRGNSAVANLFYSQSSTAGTWTSAGSMSTIRLGHAAARLPDGRVLVVGGKNGTTVHSSAEIWSPSTNSWSATASMPAARWGATATLVGGKVLVAGGASTSSGNGLRNAYLFDPATSSWTSTGLMSVGRRGHVAALTATGRVVVAGSDGGVETDTAEIFEPSTATFRKAGALTETRPGQRVTVVSTGVLVTGGDDTVSAFGSKASELYAPIADGAACVIGQDCASGHCVDGVCCASASCAGAMRCDLAPKKGTCSLPQGSSCASAAQCASNRCVDGRCCDGACTGQCEACNVAGKEGTCSPVLGAPIGPRTACAGSSSSDPCAKQYCDGSDRTKCHYPAAGKVDCGANACSGGLETHLAKCDGAGKCGDVAKACNPYVCGPTRCKASCATNADCVAGRYCDTTIAECVPLEGLGSKCSDVIPCSKGLFCTNGFCCGVAKCDEGASCGVEGSEGTCTRVNGSACTADAECGSGHCVDGVCCDRACTGQCEACNVFDATTGLAGKCIPVTGVPHGKRTPCEGGEDVCGAKQCDGKAVDACASLVGSDVVCRSGSCAAGVQTLEAKCDGAGACPSAVTKSCGGYACTLDGLGCETGCTSSEQCATGYRCEGGKCVEPTASCSDDKKLSIAKDGTLTSCAPYTCRTDGRCGERCATTPECAPGHVCSSGVCEPIPGPAPSEDAGGCSMSTRGRAGSPFALLAFATVFALRRRRLAALAGAAFALGCSSERAPAPTATEGTTATSATKREASAIVDEVRRHGDLGKGILPGNVIVPRGGSLAVADEVGAFDIEMPTRANGIARLVSRRDPSVWLEIRSLTSPASPGVPSDGAVAYAGAGDDEDVVMMPSPGRLEEVRVVRRPAATITATYALRAGPGVAEVRLRNGNVEVVDAAGYVHFVTERMYAVDVHGAVRDVRASLAQDGDGWRMSTILDAAGLAPPIAVDPAWTAVSSMNQERSGHALVALADGRVLAIGGQYNSGIELASVEIYDPVTNVWTNRASLPKARWGHAAALITSGGLAGRVVVAGGYNGGDFTVASSTSVYDPATNTWASGPTLKVARSEPASALLSGSKLFLTSGSTGEVWDTSAGTTTSASNVMSASRQGGTAVAMPTGNVLVVGGTVSGTPTALVHEYRASTNNFASRASMTGGGRQRLMAALVAGKVLVAGGHNGTSALASALLFDPIAGSWSTTGSMFYSRDDGRLVTLSNGRALSIAGTASTYTEIYNPGTGTWSLASFYSRQRTNLEAALLADGSVLAAGGFSGKTLANVDRYAPGALGNACGTGNDCLSGYCTNGVCCSTGSCSAGAACNRPKTLGTCTKALGIACTSGSECESGSCVDGVCCNTACAGQCEACNVAGKAGTCFPVSGDPVGSRPACAPGGSDPCAAKTCDGFDASKCNYLPAGTTKCGTTACSKGVATTAGTCNGAGVCNDTTKSCGAYACAGTACGSKCASAADCASGFYCDGASGTCVANEGLGQKCSATVPCKSGLSCVDGWCCGVSSCGEGATCGWFGKEGTCTKVNGAACAAGAECGSGHCVDGVCCDSACTGQCEACDIVESATGRAGRCLPTVGAPHGARPTCPSDPGNVCSGSQCGGEDRTKCTVFVGSWKSCRTQSCKDGVVTLPAQCDGKGACPAVVTASCEAYACTADGARCRTSCEASADCANGYVCIGDKCEKRAAECSQDKASSIPNGGAPVSCAPYLCVETGACGSACHTSDECAPGYLCDPSGACIAPPATADDGGCTYGRGAGSTGLAAFGLSLVAGVLRRRRARASAVRL